MLIDGYDAVRQAQALAATCTHCTARGIILRAGSLYCTSCDPAHLDSSRCGCGRAAVGTRNGSLACGPCMVSA